MSKHTGMPIGKLLLAPLCLVAVFAHGKTCIWTGGGDGVSFANASNWDNGVPLAGDSAVFRPSGNLYISFSARTEGLGELRFESGNTVFGITQTKANLNIDTSSSIYVAAQATAAISNRVAGIDAGTQLTISGGGALEFNSDQMDNAGYLDLVDITEGTSVTYYRGKGAWRPNVTRIRSGSSMSFKGIKSYQKATSGHKKWASFQVDKGGVLDFYYSEGATFGAVSGEGTLRIGGTCSFTNALDSGSAVFGGDTEFYTSNASLELTISPEDPTSTYMISSQDAFANIDVVDSGALRFSGSPNAYRIRSYRSPDASGFALGSASVSPIALFGDWKSNEYDSVSILPCRTGAILGDVGGAAAIGASSLWLSGTGADGGIPDISISDGGTLVQCTTYSPRPSASAANPAVIAFDGGTYRASLLQTDEDSTFGPLGGAVKSSNVVVRVGAGGMRMGVCDEGSAFRRTVAINAPIVASASPDGGFTRDVGSGTFSFAHHLSLAGPFMSLDGRVTIAPVVDEELVENPSWFGTGDIVFRNSILSVYRLANGASVSLASGSGSSFRYENVASIQFASDNASAADSQSVTIGSAGAVPDSALVRGGKGGVLYLWDHKSYGSGLFDGTGSSLTVCGGISTNASGTVRQPVVLYSKLDNRNYFATCRDDGSIRVFTGYKTTLDGVTSADIVSLSAAATVQENTHAYVGGLKLSGSSATFTIGQNATLHVGNGTDPALVFIDKPHLYGQEGGAIDFGGSEGVFAGIAENTIIQPIIKGTGGITFVSPPDKTSNATRRYVRVRGENLYSGGTYVGSIRLSPENAGAFGVGDVYVSGGHDYGGRIQFNTAGLVFANNFHVAGRGMHETSTSDGLSGYGALSFTASTEISGDVELVEATRICCRNAGDTATFSGRVSGDALQLYNGAGVVMFTDVNTYTGGTEIVASILKLSEGGTLGPGDVLLDGGTLVIDKDDPFGIVNRITGKGTVRLEGKGSVSFDGGLECNSYSEQVSDNFTLVLGNRRRFSVSTLDGFSEVTSEYAGRVDLYVADGNAFAGTMSANIVFHAGEYTPQGTVFTLR